MKKKYGVWGLGVVGKSVLSYLHSRGYKLSAMDKRIPSFEEEQFLKQIECSFFHESEKSAFLEMNDLIVISPGINRDNTAFYQHKFIEELDIFHENWPEKIISITGTLGKTSTTHLLDNLLQSNGVKVSTGGNIGLGMLDLLKDAQSKDYCLLELSSFQLEECRQFASDIAIWTNVHENHIDRHGTFEQYFKAKAQIFMRQKPHQKVLLPLSFALAQCEIKKADQKTEILESTKKEIKKHTETWKLAQPYLQKLSNRPVHYFTTSLENEKELTVLNPHDRVYALKDDYIVRIEKNGSATTRIFPINKLPKLSFMENWLVIIAVADMLELITDRFILPEFTLPAHRIEKLAECNGITIYDDSKSSIMEATFAAIDTIGSKNIHLLLGGISKGVDRTQLIARLKGKVASITCFGAEAEQLNHAANSNEIESYASSDLEKAFESTISRAKQGDVILFSPAGASYDLYKNYIERGNRFKELVQEHVKNCV